MPSYEAFFVDTEAPVHIVLEAPANPFASVDREQSFLLLLWAWLGLNPAAWWGLLLLLLLLLR